MEPPIGSPSLASSRERTLGVVFAFSIALACWLALTVPVFAQEAYYWTYAQHPDLSYFDHPPMVAWLIALGTKVLGHGALGVRFGTVFCGVGATWAGLLLLRRFDGDATAQKAWLVASLAMPMLLVSRFFATPDAPLMLGWMVALYALWRARDTGALRWWLLAGAMAGFGLLAKYAAAFLAAGGVLTLLWDPAFRRQWLRAGPWLGVLTAALVFSPVVIWNARNGFESFLFQTDGRYSKGEFGFEHLTTTLWMQSGLYHPVLVLLTLCALPWLVRRAWSGDPRARFLIAFGLPLPLFFLANSFYIRIKPNWFLPAFPALLIGTILWWRESGVALRVPRALAIARKVLLVSAALPLLGPVMNVVPIGAGSSATGWDELAQRAEHWEETLDPLDGVEGNVFFFCSDYRDAAQLGRHLRILAERGGAHALEPTLAQNVFGMPSLQFDHWDQPSARIGQDAIYVLPRADKRPGEIQKLQARFASVERKERVVVERFGIRLYYADVYACRGYRGPHVAGE